MSVLSCPLFWISNVLVKKLIKKLFLVQRYAEKQRKKIVTFTPSKLEMEKELGFGGFFEKKLLTVPCT